MLFREQRLRRRPRLPRFEEEAALQNHASGNARRPWALTLTLGALGVVYGDLGTNPLFALQECFSGAHALAATAPNILGVLSLVFWALVFVVAIKYLSFVMRASNDGEGGILALLALIPKIGVGQAAERPKVILLIVLFGAALLYGDGAITPAISVLSAVEGIKLVAPALSKFVVPITVAILAALFWFQKYGTARIGNVFGPVMVIWFLSIGALGARQIVSAPAVLAALSPHYAVSFLFHGGWHAFLVLSAVVLCIAGGEALYADMGHFGRRPIALAWYGLVMPTLILNYFGQGAYLLGGHASGASVFYAIVPPALLIPMVVLATFATVIASQALISGAYSLTYQAVQLGLCPRVRIVHTSEDHSGQIYVPEVNGVLMVACLALVLHFGSSERLAAAYGLAVTGTMSITSVAYFVVLTQTWKWSLWKAVPLVAAFLVVDLAFLSANLTKFLAGGWVPVAIGVGVFALMASWIAGRRRLARSLTESAFPFDDFLKDIAAHAPPRVRGTGVFLTANPKGVPPVLFHHFKHNQVLHEKVVLLSIVNASAPYVESARRLVVHDRGEGIYQVIARYGFMESPDVPALLEACKPMGLDIDLSRATYYLGRETLLVPEKAGLRHAWKRLFALISRNAQNATAYFRIPPNRVVELGMQIEI